MQIFDKNYKFSITIKKIIADHWQDCTTKEEPWLFLCIYINKDELVYCPPHAAGHGLWVMPAMCCIWL